MVDRIHVTPATCEFYPGSPGYVLDKDYQITPDLWVPAGFWYNGASIPALLWPLIYSPFDPRIMDAAAAHDWLYTTKFLPKRVADRILAERMLELGASRSKTFLVHQGVQKFGNSAWEDSVRDRMYFDHIRKKLMAERNDVYKFGILLYTS